PIFVERAATPEMVREHSLYHGVKLSQAREMDAPIGPICNNIKMAGGADMRCHVCGSPSATAALAAAAHCQRSPPFFALVLSISLRGPVARASRSSCVAAPCPAARG